MLLQEDTTIHPNLKDYYKMLDDVVKDGRSLYDLTEHESSDFESLMGSDNSTDTYIQSLLAIPRLQTYNRVPQPTAESSKRPNQSMHPKNASWLYPNPATHTFNIASNVLWDTATLYNLHGREVAGYAYANQPLPLPDNLPNGMYIVRLILQNGQTQSAKLVIFK
ncbi:MAG: T9SS type A sorting domain-containing protein [Sphingobacteriales bacterium]|nr:MAG: T9SS type A sorting domain-containing protein [Sphingobacteriales bacterium]